MDSQRTPSHVEIAARNLFEGHWLVPSLILVALAICAARSIGVIA